MDRPTRAIPVGAVAPVDSTPPEAAPGVPPAADRAARARRTVVYGVDVRSFSGNGLRGVAERLPDLRGLGMDAIWLAPITAAMPGDYGYGVTDYFAVREEYGTLEDLRALVDTAHALGMRVLMDMVPNHTSDRHPYYLDAAKHGEVSPWYDWYDRDEAGTPTHYFNWEHLPNLNVDHPEVRRFITEAFAWWMRECGTDGFRVDAAWGIRERRPDYWREWSAALRRIKPDALLIAEASARDPFYVRNGFDAAYDWTHDLGVWAWTDAFDGSAPMSVALRDALARDPAHDPSGPLVFRFLNNNDTGERFIDRHGIGAYRVALAMLLTLPGIPCLYTGDEVGASYQPYAGVTRIDWTDHHDLRGFVARLIRVRNDEPALHAPRWDLLDAAPETSILAYLRRSDEGPGGVTVVLNYSPSEVEATVAPRGEIPATSTMVDLWSGERLPRASGGVLSVPIEGWGFRILAEVAA